MKHYDMIVIGSGSGMTLVDEGTHHGLKIALVDRGPLGGTCLNVGCIPSKMLIFPADRIMEIREAARLGIKAEIKSIDFSAIMRRMRKIISESQRHMREGLRNAENLDLYEGEGRFVADYTMEVGGKKIKGDKIIIASGSRPFIPPLKGIDKVDYLTNETLLHLRKLPESLIIIGGGYIAVEYGHFFAAMGTKVTMLEMADRLVLAEEPEIAELLRKKLAERMEIVTGVQAGEVRPHRDGASVTVKDRKTGAPGEFRAERILMAVGRRSNADLLDVEKTGVKTDQRGFIQVNEHLETSKKGIYAIGDANGQQMFTHEANQEAAIVTHNLLYDGKLVVDWSTVPHAVYSHPQIASVGLTEAAARKDHEVLVGVAHYSDVAKGEAMMETEGFAKVIVDKKSEHILGFHIIGPYAPILIQEVVNAMVSGGHIDEINGGQHIHPALSELVQLTVNSAEEPEGYRRNAGRHFPRE
ncbi:MAG: dihydrolipoyl dehydrogenase [Chloroflexota bacterium]